MLDLQSLANLSEVVGALFLVGGIVFAVIQIRQFQRQRQETAAIELIRAWHNLLHWPGLDRGQNLQRPFLRRITATALFLS